MHLILERCLDVNLLTDEAFECIVFLAKNVNLYQPNINNETAWSLASQLADEGIENVLAMFECRDYEIKKDNVSSTKQYIRKRHMDTDVADIMESIQSFDLNQSKGVLSTKRTRQGDNPTDDYGFSPLPNVGNSCFINSSIQIIAAIYSREVTGSLLKGTINKINSNIAISSEYMSDFIVKLSDIARQAACSKGESESITKFFLTGEQQDPCEFLNRIIDTNMLTLPDCQKTERLIFKDHKGMCWYKEQEVADRSSLWNISVPKGIPLSEAINRGHSEQIKQISREVKQAFNEYKKLDQIVLSPSENIKVAGLKEAILQGVESPSTVDCIKQIIINKFPSKLGIHIRRSEYINVDLSSKIQNSIEGVTEISIQPDPNKNHAHIFYLTGFVLHKGCLVNNGHYLAYVKRKKQWYKVDDANFTGITPISNESAILKAREAYLLFYEEG